ncbi:DNA-3-methyladenine glycosylase I [Neisseriaceae bacterium PsAf]|nr:DNA-3-methyladenine glycosylase I [Neisseriaceae bacterium PsAf]
MTDFLPRCPWVTDDTTYIQYHDYEWGKINQNSQSLFELLCLEGQQAGLSWITILKRRIAYRECFYHFDAKQIVKMSEKEIFSLMQDSRIIKNKLKILSIIQNAKSYLAIQKEQSFSDFLWEIVGYEPIINHWEDMSQVPTQTELSEQLSKKLKKAGFTFVGPTICYAFMQACGMVNDHLITCFCHPNQID